MNHPGICLPGNLLLSSALNLSSNSRAYEHTLMPLAIFPTRRVAARSQGSEQLPLPEGGFLSHRSPFKQ